ncbi:MAG: hypothetical protein KDI36_12170 [Pseudomonadales bacterium]|nr:hypothetical protein [Pseudomonadales bacterium]
MRNIVLAISFTLASSFLALLVTVPALAAVQATAISGATGIDTYYIRSDRGEVWRAVDNLAGWKNGRHDPFTETRRDPGVIELTNDKTGVTRFDFETGEIFSIPKKSSAPKKIGLMSSAHQLSPELVNSFTYIAREDVGWVETTWDQIYLNKDEGEASGWVSEVSVSRSAVAMSAAKKGGTNFNDIARLAGFCSLECRFQQLNGLEIWRVELGDIFFKLFTTGGEDVLPVSSYLDKIQAKSVVFREESRAANSIHLVHGSGVKVELRLDKQEIWAAKKDQSLRLMAYIAPEPFQGWNTFALKDSENADAGVRTLLGTVGASAGLRDVRVKSDGHSSFSFIIPDKSNAGSFITGQVNVAEAGKGDGVVGKITASGVTRNIMMPFGATVGGRSVTAYSLGSLGWDARKSSLASNVRRSVNSPRLEMSYIQLKGRSEFTLIEPDSRREFSNSLVGMYKSRTRFFGQQNGVPLVVNLASSRLEALNDAATRLLTDRENVPHTRLTWAHSYYPGQFEKHVPSLKRGESPGFQVQNRTDWPVYVQLAQGSTCYNRKILQPGESVNWDTGAVWFAIEATMNQTNVPTDVECGTQAMIIAGATVVGGIIAASTAGAGAGASSALVAMATSGTFGAFGEYATSAMNAAEWTDEEKQGFQIAMFIVEGVASMGMSTASAGSEAFEAATDGLTVVAKLAAKDTTRAAVKKAVMEELAEGMTGFILDSHLEVGLNLLENGTQFDAEIRSGDDFSAAEQEALTDEIDLNQFASLNDQYAGKTWPFVGEDRIRPTYVITGGPLFRRGVDGVSEFIIEEVEEMKVQKCDFNTRSETYKCVGDSD